MLSSLSVILVYLVAQRLYDTRAATAAAILSALSPFMIVMSGDFMTHTATHFFIVTALLLTLSYLHNPRRLVGIACGLTWGYAVAIRQLSAGVIAAACATYVAATVPPRTLMRLSAAPILGLAAIAFLYFIDNWFITADPFISPYKAFHGVSVAPHNLPFGCNWLDSTLGFLPQILFAPPLGLLVLALSALPLIIDRSRKELFLCSILPLVVVAHCFYSSHGIHGYGPRFLFEALFAVFIGAGRGILILWERFSSTVRALLVPACIVAFAYNVTVVVKVLPSYRDYNSINSELASEIQKIRGQRAVVLAESNSWYSLDVATRLFDPSFKDFIILGKSPDDSHNTLLKQLEGRPLYQVTNQKLSVVDN
jgi:4-amino-4-deoxy-L-arabinose transferase-like glycosyltransferase